MTRSLLSRPFAAARNRRVVWVTAGLAAAGVAIAGGAQALALTGHPSTTGAASTSGAVPGQPRPTSSPAAVRTPGPATRASEAVTPGAKPRASATTGDDDAATGLPVDRNRRGRFCVHLDAKALAAIAAAKRSADGGIDLPLAGVHLSRCTATRSPRPSLSPLPLVSALSPAPR